MHDQISSKEFYQWIKDEECELLLGVLATVSEKGNPYTRTIAIREIDERGPLFFTQKQSTKVRHMSQLPRVALTLSFPQTGRQITFRGEAIPLLDEENDAYWASYTQKGRLRFLVYGPKSGRNLSEFGSLDQDLA